MPSQAQTNDDANWFADARLGLFCHFGLYSLLGRGEWVMNRERIPVAEYEKLAKRFHARKFDADALADLAVELGARYISFTTKHHEGFCLFDTKLTDYNSVQIGPKRDLVAEVVEACRRRGLKISLYYSLNDNHIQPDSVAAYEDYIANGKQGKMYSQYIEYIFGQIRELMTNYGKIDVMWYDGWWPFDAEGWQAERMNAMVRELQPGILINGRNCLPGDFDTPEQHLAGEMTRVWEACFTLNNSWGFHRHDHEWKSPAALRDLIITGAQQQGNLLINVGPKGDGSIPAPSLKVLREVGRWVQANEEALRPGMIQPNMDWTNHNADKWSARPGVVYMHVIRWAGSKLVMNGVKGTVKAVRFVDKDAAGGQTSIKFKQEDGRLELYDLPSSPPDRLATVIALEHDGDLSMYQCGGMRVPNVRHPQYDPIIADREAPPG